MIMKFLFILFAFLSINANAAIVTGDFRTEGDLPYCCAASGPLVYENLNAPVGVGNELTGANLLSNPSSWSAGLVHLDLNPITNILTLDSQDTLDFEIFDVFITNIAFDAGEIISGFSFLSGGITDIGLVPALSFTNNSLHISYDVGSGNPEFNFNNAQVQFQITTSSSTVPAPAAILLIGSGLIGLVGRRKKSVKLSGNHA